MTRVVQAVHNVLGGGGWGCHIWKRSQVLLRKITKTICERLFDILDLFRLCNPRTLGAPQLHNTCNYIVNRYVKILLVHLGGENNMRPLSWGGGGYKRKRSNIFIEVLG